MNDLWLVLLVVGVSRLLVWGTLWYAAREDGGLHPIYRKGEKADASRTAAIL